MGDVSVVNAAAKAYLSAIALHNELVRWSSGLNAETPAVARLMNLTRNIALNISVEFAHVHKDVREVKATEAWMGERW